MFFRLAYTLKPINLGESDSLQLNVKTEGSPINIELKKIPKEDLRSGQTIGDLLCTATIERNISEKQKALFETMEKDIPTGLAQRISEITNMLYDGIEYAIKVVRWRRGIPDYHDFIRSGSILGYSFDGKNWKSCTGQLRLTVEFGTPLQKFTDVEEYNKLIKNEVSEPLGHELLCEAWFQRKSNPRSSLVIGVAAAETGFKECIIN